MKTNMKKMYALTFCYEACDGNSPYAQTIAVSESQDALVQEMQKCLDEDTKIDEEDEWNEDCNYKVVSQDDSDAMLQHSSRINLYTHYSIRPVDVI